MKRLSILFILFFGLCSLLHSQSTHISFAQIYTTLDKLELQVNELNLNLITQRALSAQLQDQLNQATVNLTASQQDYNQAKTQLEQSQTALEQASKDAEMQKKQLLSYEKKFKTWRNVSIIMTATSITAITILILRK